MPRITPRVAPLWLRHPREEALLPDTFKRREAELHRWGQEAVEACLSVDLEDIAMAGNNQVFENTRNDIG